MPGSGVTRLPAGTRDGPGSSVQVQGRAHAYYTRPRFAAAVRSALKKAGVDQSKYCTHSFRIGAVTTAAANRGFGYKNPRKVGESGVLTVRPYS